MAYLIGVRFENAGKLFYCDPNRLWPVPGEKVIVETSRGLEMGEVIVPVRKIDDAQLSAPLTLVQRIATQEDLAHAEKNRQLAAEAFALCKKKVAEHKLEMKLVCAEYTFDNSKIIFSFTANGRVDFRSLVKDLGSSLHTRIDLRQIGVRDEARMLGGLGPCGRPICCGKFLGDFQPVSIKMAKEQNLSLNPTKISGICGRLMCCLKYEEEHYEAAHKSMPRVGREIKTPDGYGTVTEINVIRETVKVRLMKGDSGEVKEFRMEELGYVPKNEQLAKREADRSQAAQPGCPACPCRRTDSEEADTKPVKETKTESPVPEKEQPHAAEKPANNWRQKLEAAMRAASHAEQDGAKP